jgi:hypothetical protein
MTTRIVSNPRPCRILLHPAALSCWLLMVGLVAGCSPAGMAVKIGTYAVGKVVNDAETQDMADQLMGRAPSAADAKLGQPVDVLQDVSSPRQWRTYKVKMDVLDMQRYVVEVTGNRIVGVDKVERPTGGVDIARALAYEGMIKGKPAPECQEKLGMDPPVLVVRSMKTGTLIQLYNASVIEGLSQKYCVVRLGRDGLCEKVELVDVAASQGAPLPG